MKKRFPFLTLSVTLAALAVYAAPGLSALLVYNRSSILQGEWWRLFTAPLVHFSSSHLFWDALVFAGAGTAVEWLDYRRFWLACTVAAFLPGLYYLAFKPHLLVYGGLSGLSTGAVVYLALHRAKRGGWESAAWTAVLVLVAAKIAVEAGLHHAIFARAGAQPFPVLPSAHIAGCLGACAAFIVDLLKKSPA